MANYSYKFRKFRKTLQSIDSREFFKEEYYKQRKYNSLIQLSEKRVDFPRDYLLHAFLWDTSISEGVFWRLVYQKLKELGY